MTTEPNAKFPHAADPTRVRASVSRATVNALRLYEFYEAANGRPRMATDKLNFTVVGSTGVVYGLQATRPGGVLRVTCECEAAHNGLPCHHRLKLLFGDPSAIDTGQNNLDTLLKWLSGSALAASLEEVATAQRAVDDAQRTLKAAKRKLGRVMTGT